MMREKQTRDVRTRRTGATRKPAAAMYNRILETSRAVTLGDAEGGLAQLKAEARAELCTLCAAYLDSVAERAEQASRVSLLQQLEGAAIKLELPSGTALSLLLQQLALAARAVREGARTTTELTELWDASSEIEAVVRGDASASAATAHDRAFAAFAQEVTENEQATSSALLMLAQATTPIDAAERVLGRMRDALGWDVGLYFQLHEYDGTLLLARTAGELSETLLATCARACISRRSGTIGAAWRSREISVSTLALETEDELEAALYRDGVKTLIALPLVLEQQVVGVMAFLVRRELTLTDSRRDVLRNVAMLLSSSFERMAQVVEMRDLAASAEAVNQVLRRLNVASTAAEAAHGAVEALREAFEWDYGAAWSLDAASDELYCSAESGQSSEDFRRATLRTRYGRGVGVNGTALEHREFVVVDDLGNVEGEPRAAEARTAGIRSGVCFPVVARDEVVGTIEVWAKRPLVLSDARLAALRSVSHAVSSTLERLQERDAFARTLQSFSAELVEVSSSLRASSVEQSASAQELASAVGQVTATLSELRETSGEALRNAESVIAKAEGAFQTSASGRDSVQRAIDSMRNIREQVGEIAERILQLNDQTSQIGSIISTVNEISAQSKLLALNAAIEAARAGEHGKGFGVVANEIRSLAEQSKEATGQVRDILGEIQAGTNAAVVAAEEGTKKAESGMALADVSGERILELARSMEESSSSARLIANSARQQSAGVEQVAQALVSIDSATNATASGLRQTEQATTQLLMLAERMAEAVRAMAPVRPLLTGSASAENQNAAE